MHYTLKNITLRILKGDNKYSGQCSICIPEDYGPSFFTKENGFDCILNEDEFNWAKENECELFIHNRGTINWIDGAYQTSSAFIFILFVNWLMGTKAHHTIEGYYNHPLWAIHDMLHAVNDVKSGDIIIDSTIERKRIYQALDILKEAHFPLDLKMLGKIEEEFYEQTAEQIFLIQRTFF